MSAERVCFGVGTDRLDDIEVRYRALSYTQEQYCRFSYETLETLDVCLKKSETLLPSSLKFLEKWVDDFETISQYRPKSLSAMQAQHDLACQPFPDFLYTQPTQ